MRKFTVLMAATCVLLQPCAPAGAAGADGRTERVRFARGATAAVIKDRLTGYAYVDYQLQAGAGQTMTVSLKRSNPQNYFNVLPPGSTDVAMYVGQIGEDFTGVLPDDGDYTIRVYLMRAAARRNESSDFTLTVGVTGKALAPLADGSDALVPGTRFHATAPVDCTVYPATQPRQCEASVIRRGRDGTATVVVPGVYDGRRRILFVHGKGVASDSQNAMTVTRQDDVSVVSIGTDERYEIPDALLTGG